jgi:hypothetical protein
MVGHSLAWTLAFVGAAALAQPIVKCVDADGNVTYQDAPCAGGKPGRSVDLPKVEPREDTTPWEAAARESRIVRGMPKRWVLRSRGAPVEIRAADAREEATEVWRYGGKDAVLVGFAGPNVAWVRDDVAPAAAPSRPAPAAEPTRGAQNRRFVIAGRYCEHVFAEIGVADREEAAPPGPLADAAKPAGGKRYTYEPGAGDPAMRTTFSCIDGKVADVERVMVK